MADGTNLAAVNHVVVLMLENRSFDHMLGYLYADAGNVSPSGQPFEGLTGSESNPDASGSPVTVYPIDVTQPGAYFMPGADPGEGYVNTNQQLFGSTKAPSPPTATSPGCRTTRSTRSRCEEVSPAAAPRPRRHSGRDVASAPPWWGRARPFLRR